MDKPIPPVSLADLSAAGIRLRPYEAATIVRELSLQVARGELAGVPSSHVIRLSSAGQICVEGPVGAGGPSVARAAQLLDSLLPGGEAGSQLRVPGGLRLVVARGRGTLDLPPFRSLEAFAEALSRFASSDPGGMVTNLVVAWSECVGGRAPDHAGDANELAASGMAQVEPFVDPRIPSDQGELTVSDIRRARRATGLTLTQVSTRSQIPVSLLRQLEWGYLLNWPAGQYGARLLARYAQATGLDQDVVQTTIAPLLIEAEQRRTARVRTTQPLDERLERDPDVLPPVPAFSIPESSTRSPWTAALAALAIPALLVIAFVPAWWGSYSRPAHDVATPIVAPEVQERTERSGAETMVPPAPDSPDALAQAPAALPEESVPTQADTREPTTAPADAPAVATTGSSPREAVPAANIDPPLQRSGPAPDDVMFDASHPITALASVGTAMFSPPGADEQPAVIPANAAGDSVLRITRIVDDAANNLHLRVSPDGRQVAFDSDRDGVRGVYVAESDGTNVRRVSGEGPAALPSWAPNGRTLAIVRSDPARPAVWHLWTLDLSSGEMRQITDHASGLPHGASWFPDGRRLAYGHGERLLVRDLQTGVDRVFASPRSGRRVINPAVSPDGRRIIFHVERDGGWILELRDASMRRVLEDTTAEEYTWSPDGRRVAYHSARAGGWNVWVMAHR